MNWPRPSAPISTGPGIRRARFRTPCRGSETRVEACELLGDLYPRMQERGWTDEFDVWQAVLNHLDPSADPARAARAAIRAASARIKESRLDEARLLLAQAESWLTGDHPLWSHLLSERAQLLIRESQYREALRIAREAVEVADRRGTLLDRSHALSTLAHPAILPLMGEEGRRLMRSWVAEVATKGEERLLTDARHIVASDIWTRGMVDEELFRFIEDGVARAAEFGWTRDEIGLRMMLGWGDFLTRGWAGGSAPLERGHVLREAIIGGCRANGTAAEFDAARELAAAEVLGEAGAGTPGELGAVAARIRARRA